MKAPASPVRRVLTAMAGVLAIAIVGAAAWFGYDSALSQPFKRVVFAGDLNRLSHAELEALSRAIQGAAPGSATLASVREAARRVPWVREATVRRQFPDAVEITFQVHEVFARWNDGHLLSRRGEVFAAAGLESAKLPRFHGPEAAGPTMVSEYAALALSLAPLGSPIAELRLSPRGAWQVRLDSGLVLELGRSEMSARAERFAAAWPRIAARAEATIHADLRYPNGFALLKKK